MIRPVLVGRAYELTRLAALLDADRAVVVVGEAGVGKTALLDAVAAASGREVHAGGGLSTLRWMDNLPLRRALGRPPIGNDPTTVAAEVESAVGAGVLVLDDLQWADRSTLTVTGILAGRLGLLAGVRRGDPAADGVLDTLRGAGFEQLDLEPLNQAESAALVRTLRPDLSPPAIDRLVARTGGNPLLLHELAASGEPTPSLRLALAARLRQLDAVGREAFGILALAGRPVPAEALGRAGVKSLTDAGLVVLDSDGAVPRHPLLGEVMIELLAEDERHALHARIAREVDDVGEAARHHARAGEPELAFAAALRAAEATASPGERASHLALAASCATGPRADELRLRAAWALEEAHDWTGMLAVLDRLDGREPETQATAALLRARGAWAAGDPEGLQRSIEDGLDLVAGTGLPVEIRLRIESSRIPIFVRADPAEGARVSREALELAERLGIDVPRARYLHGTALYYSDPVAAEPILRDSIAEARAAGDTNTEFLAVNNTIALLESAGSHEQGRELAAEYITRAEALGLGEWQRALEVTVAGLDFHDGHCLRVVDRAERLLGGPMESRARDALIELMGLALVDLGRGDEALRRAAVLYPEGARDEWSEQGELMMRLEAALWGGRPQQALELSERLLSSSRPLDANLTLVRVSRAWALHDLGREPEEPVPAQTIVMVNAAPPETTGLRLLHCGENAAAVEAFAEAARLWAPYHRRGELRCLWAAAEARRRAGEIDQAVRELEAVEARAAELGMLPILGRVHRSLRAAGRARSAPRQPGRGVLTARELAVLELVGQGRTNAEIAAQLGVSRPTVASQIASASAKLGAANRRQAATLALAEPTDAGRTDARRTEAGRT